MIEPLFKHQEKMAQFALAHDRVFNVSDPGTGKTRGTLEGYMRRILGYSAGRMLVVAPLSILEAAWGDDIKKYFPNLSYAVAHGKGNLAYRRADAFQSDARVVLINHDGVKAIEIYPEYLEGFTDLVIDESTAFKNRTAQRSKAALRLTHHFRHITLLTGSPSPNTITDIWFQAFLLDKGKRLGNRFFNFRSQVCTPIQVGPSPDHIQWQDKPGAADEVADALSDISIRYKLEDCIDMPSHRTIKYMVDMPLKVMNAYKQMENDAVIATSTGEVTAIHAGAKVKKMLQIISGAVYDSAGVAHAVHNDRYKLVLQLVQERPQSLVAFNWTHEREALVALAKKSHVSHAIIDGSVKPADRTQAVQDFQDGKLQVIFCHPQSAGHGLTLTQGIATIWCSATYNLEHFIQFNRRIYRAGQTHQTETICIAARNTQEEEVYNKLNAKDIRMTDLLNTFVEGAKNASISK